MISAVINSENSTFKMRLEIYKNIFPYFFRARFELGHGLIKLKFCKLQI